MKFPQTTYPKSQKKTSLFTLSVPQIFKFPPFFKSSKPPASSATSLTSPQPEKPRPLPEKHASKGTTCAVSLATKKKVRGATVNGEERLGSGSTVAPPSRTAARRGSRRPAHKRRRAPQSRACTLSGKRNPNRRTEGEARRFASSLVRQSRDGKRRPRAGPNVIDSRGRVAPRRRRNVVEIRAREELERRIPLSPDTRTARPSSPAEQRRRGSERGTRGPTAYVDDDDGSSWFREARPVRGHRDRSPSRVRVVCRPRGTPRPGGFVRRAVTCATRVYLVHKCFCRGLPR
ncbi:uncharacterized protein LOC143180064 [Calliopsis andreniformis]|uniref:uncharacterized protein LOC143180064 n=1 Tax=Calliopsis andreniformis TaxID=337506 RepID=UPI003FCC6C1D